MIHSVQEHVEEMRANMQKILKVGGNWSDIHYAIRRLDELISEMEKEVKEDALCKERCDKCNRKQRRVSTYSVFKTICRECIDEMEENG